MLQQIDAEEAAEIEVERTTVQEEAIVEPYSEVQERDYLSLGVGVFTLASFFFLKPIYLVS